MCTTHRDIVSCRLVNSAEYVFTIKVLPAIGTERPSALDTYDGSATPSYGSTTKLTPDDARDSASNSFVTSSPNMVAALVTVAASYSLVSAPRKFGCCISSLDVTPLLLEFVSLPTSSYSRTVWVTSKKRCAVSANVAIHRAKVTRTMIVGSVIICETRLNIYCGNIFESDGGKVVIIDRVVVMTCTALARTKGSESCSRETVTGTILCNRISSET